MLAKHCFIFTGPTGCGKTYSAFYRRNKHAKTAYLAPCRQLVYESAQKYGNSRCHIKTSDMEVGNRETAPISFRTFESFGTDECSKYSLIIIDEAHFINDRERGSHLLSIIYNAEKNGVKTILLSATMGFTIAGAKIIKLPPRGQQFQKREVTYSEALERAKDGVPTLIFKKYREDCGATARRLGIKGVAITANTSVADRIRLIKLYERGIVTLIESTNALAQGVNVPCENLIIEYNSWDDPAVIIQKIGRLGRTGVTRENAELTFCCQCRDATEIDFMREGFEHPHKIIEIKSIQEKSCIDYDLKTLATAEEVAKTKKNIMKVWSRK